MNIEVGRTYVSNDKRYRVTVNQLGGKYIAGTYIYVNSFGEEDRAERTNSDWCLDGTYVGSRKEEMSLTEEYYVGPPDKLLCSCVWNKHPMFCKCKE